MSLGRRRRSEAAEAYRAARQPRAHERWSSASWCVVDLELSGLDPRRHEIVSFGAIPIEHGRVQLGEAVAGLVRPLRPMSAASIRIHGIREPDLAAAPPLEDAIGPLLRAMAGRALVAHVARIERAFLGRALRSQGLRLRGPIADTSVIARLWLCERDGQVPPEVSLHGLAHMLGLPARAHHDALGDALTTAQLFIAAVSHLDAVRRETVRSLARADRRLQTRIAYPPG
jgi:DNA polymerase III subunit epsilon